MYRTLVWKRRWFRVISFLSISDDEPVPNDGPLNFILLLALLSIIDVIAASIGWGKMSFQIWLIFPVFYVIVSALHIWLYVALKGDHDIFAFDVGSTFFNLLASVLGTMIIFSLIYFKDN